LWWQEAEKNQVLPVDNRIVHTVMNPKPDRRRPRHRYVYFPGGSPVPESVAANLRNRSHRIAADVTVPADRAVEGVILAFGSALGGFSFHAMLGRLRYVHNLYGRDRHTVDASVALGAGRHLLEFRYDSTGSGGEGTLLCDGEAIGAGPIAQFTPVRFNIHGAGLSCGYELGPAIGTGYDAPFPFTGTLHSVVVTLGDPAPLLDPMAVIDSIMSEQ
jgi:arylsulfatase